MTKSTRTVSIGVEQFADRLDDLLDALTADGQEVIITRQGKPAAVILDIEKYREIQQALEEFSDPGYLASLLEAREEVRSGNGIPAKEVFRQKGL